MERRGGLAGAQRERAQAGKKKTKRRKEVKATESGAQSHQGECHAEASVRGRAGGETQTERGMETRLQSQPIKWTHSI